MSWGWTTWSLMVLSGLVHFGPAATVTKIWPLSWTCFTYHVLPVFCFFSRTESKNKSKVGKIKMMAKMAHPNLLGRQVLTRYAAFVAVRWLRQMEGAWEWKWKPFWTNYIYNIYTHWPMVCSHPSGPGLALKMTKLDSTLSSKKGRWEMKRAGERWWDGWGMGTTINTNHHLYTVKPIDLRPNSY